MRAMSLPAYGSDLVACELPEPVPSHDEVLVRISACGVCRTDLHIQDGDLREANLPIVLGHEVIGIVEQVGKAVLDICPGDVIGIPWLGKTCRQCRFCLSQRENLCDKAAFTGYHRNGGYAQYIVADAQFCFRLPEKIDPVSAAPLMCAGLIGWRALRMAGIGQKARHLWFWRGWPHHYSDCCSTRTAGLCIYTRWRHNVSGVRP